MKSLIVGINGFVGQHLRNELENHGYEVYGIDVSGGESNVIISDILNKDELTQAIERIAPDCIFNLAAQASVAYSWANPQVTFDVNVKGTLNLLDAVRAMNRPVRMIIVGSSDQYGIIKPEDCPISETFRIDPQSPYAVSKQAQENMVRIYILAYKMDIVLTRSFNHIGPGQRKGFVIADYASQIAEIERGTKSFLSVGNLDAIRDFTDIRDITTAYRLLCEKGKTGEIYNIGSGRVYSVKELLDILLSYSKADVQIQADPEKMRPSDLPFIQCGNIKIKTHTGWEPVYDIQRTLLDTLNYWRNK